MSRLPEINLPISKATLKAIINQIGLSIEEFNK